MMNAGNLNGKTRQMKDWRRRVIALAAALSLLISSCGLTAFAETDDDIYSAPVTAPIAPANTSPEPEEGGPEATPGPEGTDETGTEPQGEPGEGTESEGDPEASGEPEDLTAYEPGTLTAEADEVGVTLDYTAEARIPEGTVLTLARATGGDLYAAMKSASRLLKDEQNETWQREIGDEAVFYLLTLTNPEGTALHPAAGVKLTCTNLPVPAGSTGFVTGDDPEIIDWDNDLTLEYLPEAIGYATIKQVQTGTVTLVHNDRDYIVTASYGPEAGFPFGTELKVREIMPGTPEYALYSGMTDEALNEDWSEITLERYFDIAFVRDGVELEPQAEVDVQITFHDKIEENEDTEVAAVHIENNEATVIESETDSQKVARHDDEAIDTVSFTSDSFSVYGVVQKKKIITKILDAQGHTYEIEVTYTQEAGIPEDAQVKVDEILEGSDLWEAYRIQTAAALNADDVHLPGLYDISIIDAEGNKVEPQAPVKVAIKLLNDDTTEDIQIVHFTEEMPQELVEAAAQQTEQTTEEVTGQNETQPTEQTEVRIAEQTETQTETDPQTEEPLQTIESETITAKVEGDTVSFSTDSFSVFAFAYTVDFHYIVDGQRYDFSIPGGGYITFADIVELLHIPTARGAVRGVDEWGEETHSEAAKVGFIPDIAISDETRDFVAEVEKIEFSSPELVSVSKVESATTVGDIKGRLGLTCEYSEELTEKNIEDINSQTINAGDWVLISLRPFNTEEWLTVTMKDGEAFSIKVTDAQIRKTVKSASGDLYEIIVTYTDTAEIPDDVELMVREIMSDEEKFTSNVETANRELVAMEMDAVTNPVQFEISIVTADGIEIEPREGSIVGVEIRLVPEIFAQRLNEGTIDENLEKALEETTEENGTVFTPQVWFFGSSVDVSVEELQPQFTVVHILEDEGVEVVENLSASVSGDDRIVLQFETESFSDYMVTSGSETDLSKLPDQIYVGDEIYLFGSGRIWATAIGSVITETKHNDNDKYKTVKAISTGEFEFRTPWDGTPYVCYKKIQVLPEASRPGYDLGKPGTVQTVENASVGISLNLFDYDLDDYLDDRFNNYDYYNEQNTDVPVSAFSGYGINSGHTLKFWGSGIGEQFGLSNKYTEFSVQRGIVGSTLSNGYPVLTNGGESLEYLFGPSGGSDKRAYTKVDKLFKKQGDYYVFDSNANYAWYDSGSNQFVVYSRTYKQKSRTDGGEQATSTNNKSIGFFPFHKWDESYDLYVNWNKFLNHHFGLSMSVDFSLPKDPKAVTDSDGNPIVFEFSGDDDMWVFIDNKLIMDIGGIHQPLDGQINFQTREVTVNEDVQMSTAEFDSTFPNLFDGNKHTLKVFYLERGGCDSNCMIKFNLTQYGKLSFIKQDKNTSATKLEGAVFGIFKDAACTQPLKEQLKTGIFQDFVAVSDSNGLVEFNDLPLGTYYLKEIYAPDGYNLDNTAHVSELKIDKETSSGMERVFVTLDGKVVNDAKPGTITNEKTSVKVKKEWYHIPVDGSKETALLMTGGDPVTMNLYRKKTELSENTSGSEVKIEKNGGSHALTITGASTCKTGDIIKITATSSKNAHISFDYSDNIDPYYHGSGAFGNLYVSAGTTGSTIKTIDAGITNIYIGTWDTSEEGECTVDVQVIKRPGISATATGKELVDGPFTLSSEFGWEKTIDDLPGTDTDGGEFTYFFEEEEADGRTDSTHTMVDGVDVWTFKNYTDEPNEKNVRLRKRAIVTESAIEGAEFQIFTENPDINPEAEPIVFSEEIVENWKILNSGTTISADQKTLISDSQGRFYNGNLPLGIYYIKETKAPDNYLEDNTVYAIRITSSGMDILTDGEWVAKTKSTKGDYYELYINNIPTTSITVKKIWENSTANPVSLNLIRYKKGNAVQTNPASDTAEVFVNVGHSLIGSVNESNCGKTLTVPKGSTVTLSYQAYKLNDQNTYNPSWKLMYLENSGDRHYAEVSPEQSGPGSGTYEISIGTEDVYCIWLYGNGGYWENYNISIDQKASGTPGTSGLPTGYVRDDEFSETPIELPDGTAWQKEINNLPIYDKEGNVYYYKIEEMNVPAGYAVTYSSNNPVNANAVGDIELIATNTRLTGSLDITKRILKNGAVDTTVTTGTFYYGVYNTDYATTDPKPTAVRTGSIQITDGTGTATESELGYGTYYVYELDGEDGTPVANGLGTIGGIKYIVDGSGSPATVGSTGATVTITNTPTGSLKLKKTVSGDDPDTEKEFSFTVTILKHDDATDTDVTDADFNPTYGDFTFTDGVAEIRLKHDQSITIDGLPVGTMYEIAEYEPGYLPTVLSNDGTGTQTLPLTGTITGSETVELTVTNTKIPTVEISANKSWGTTEEALKATAVQFTLYHKIADASEATMTSDTAIRIPAESGDWYDVVADAELMTVTGDAWSSSWTELPKYVDFTAVEPVEEVYAVRETGVYFGDLTEDNPSTQDADESGQVPAGAEFIDPYMYVVSGGTVTMTEDAGNTTILNTPVTINVPVEKTWTDFEDPKFTWTATFQLEELETKVSGEDAQDAISTWTPIESKTITISKGQTEYNTFDNLPMYRIHSNGSVYRIVYAVDEISYEVSAGTTVVAKWVKGDESQTVGDVYTPQRTQDAGDLEKEAQLKDDLENWYTIRVSNTLENKTVKDYLDITLNKTWADGSFAEVSEENASATFELIRYSHEEHRDYNNVPDMNDTVTYTLGSQSLTVPKGMKLAIKVKFKSGAGGNGYAKFQIGEHDYDAVTANHYLNSSAYDIVRTNTFTAQANTIIKILDGTDDKYILAEIVDTGSPTQDVFSGVEDTVILNKAGNWAKTWNNLPKVVEDEVDEDHKTQTVHFYSYYLRETSSNPDRFYATFTADGAIISAENRIDNSTTVAAVNRPIPPLIVSKVWRGVPDPEGYPDVTFDLYQVEVDNNGYTVGSAAIAKRADGTEYAGIELSYTDNQYTWTCPEYLPDVAPNGNRYAYYVVENPAQSSGEGLAWTVYGYSQGLKQKVPSGIGNGTGAGYYEYNSPALPDQPYNAKVIGNEGELVIHNKVTKYIQIDMQKQFFIIREDGSWLNISSTSEDADLMVHKGIVLGFKVIRRIRAMDGTILRAWHEYGNEMKIGFDASGNPVGNDGGNPFILQFSNPGSWEFTILNGNEGNIASGDVIGLPSYGIYMQDGVAIPVKYNYSYRETGVYSDMAGNPHPRWEWINCPPDRYWDENGTLIDHEFGLAFANHDGKRIVNYQASNITIDKRWLGKPDAQEVYVKIFRTAGDGVEEDFTKIIADDIKGYSGYEITNWQNYVSDTSIVDTTNNWIVIKSRNDGDWTTTVKTYRAILGSGSAVYQYYIREVGYKDKNGDVHLVENDAHALDIFETRYTRWDATEQKWLDIAVADPTQASITLGRSGTNRLQVMNAPMMDLKVEKKWLDQSGQDREPWANEVNFMVKQTRTKWVNGAATDEKQSVYLTVGDGRVFTLKQQGQTATLTTDHTNHDVYGMSVSNSDAGDWTILIKDLQRGFFDAQGHEWHCEYSIEEVDTVYSSITYEDVDQHHEVITVKNTYDESKASVKVTKAFSGIDALPDNFTITATWSDGDGNTGNVETKILTLDNAQSGDGSAENPYEWTINGIPVGNTVTFTESNYEVDDVNVITMVNGVKYKGTGNPTGTAIAGNPNDPDTGEASKAILSFVNTYGKNDGTLKVIKQVPAASEETEQDFTFEITLKNPDETAYAGTVIVTDQNRNAEEITLTTPDEEGILTVTIHGAGEAIIDALPEGTTYGVKENEIEGWIETGKVFGNETKTITAGVEDTVTITNEEVVSRKAKKNWVDGRTPYPGTQVILTLNATVTGADGHPVMPNGVTIAPVNVPLDGIVDMAGDDPENPNPVYETIPWEYEWKNLPKYDSDSKLISYNVTETSYTIGEESYTVAPVDPTPTADYHFSFTNPVPTGEISVTKNWKTADGTTYVPNENERTIRFKVFYKVDGDAITEYPYITGADSEGNYSIQYNDGTGWEPVVLSDLPLYVKVTVSGADEGESTVEIVKKVTGYYVIEQDINGNQYTVAYQFKDTNGTVADVTSLLNGTIAIINTNAKIIVTKTFSGVNALPESFSITASWTEQKASDSSEESGSGDNVSSTTTKSVLLKTSENATGDTSGLSITRTEVPAVAATENVPAVPASYTWTIEGLPIGTQVTFTESNCNIDGYIWSSTVVNGDGTSSNNPVEGNGTVYAEPQTVAFTNTYTPGVELPSTGGYGTMIYTVSGMALVLLAGVWLISRKRRKN